MNTNTSSPLPEQGPVPLSTPPKHPWEKYLPSRRIRLVILVLVIGLIGYGLWRPVSRIVKSFFSKEVSVLESLVPTPTIQSSPVSLSIDKDTDGDGLADWQETLIGTDPEIPNSEAEVPKELREIITEKTSGVITTEDKLALNVYQRLLSEPVGENINQAIQAATTKEMLDLANTLEQGAPQYGYDDLDLVDMTNDAKSSYQKEMRQIQQSLTVSKETLAAIYTALLKNEKTTLLTSIQLSITQQITRLLEMPVPLPYADQHLLVINTLSKATTVFSSPVSDSSLVYAKVLAFQKNNNALVDALININSLLQITN